MNRDIYIQMRKTNQYDFGWFYEYYIDNRDSKKDTIPFEIFIQAFRMYFQMRSKDILEHLDKKFGVQLIENKEGQIIYIN